MSSSASLTSALSHFDPQTQLILEVSLPRLARHADKVLYWMEQQGQWDGRRRAAELAAIPGAEGLAVLAQLSATARAELLSLSPVTEQQRRKLSAVAARLGPAEGANPLAAAIRTVFPITIGTGEPPPAQPCDTPSTRTPDATAPGADLIPFLAATVDRWENPEEALGALNRLASAVAQFGSPLLLDFWQRAAQRLHSVSDDQQLSCLLPLGRVFHRLGAQNDALALYERALRIARSTNDPKIESLASFRMAEVLSQQGQITLAAELQEKALALNERLGDVQGTAVAWHNLATNDLRRGHFAAAREKLERAATVFEMIRDREGQASTLHQLAVIDLNQGNYAAAREGLLKVLAMRQAMGDRAEEATTLHNLASIDLNEGNFAAARENFGKALIIKQALGNRAGEAAGLGSLAAVDLNEGNYAAAREKFQASLAIEQAIGERQGESATWHNLASIDLRLNDYTAAREKFGKALVICKAIGDLAGEAAVWHEVAAIDLHEGNYATVRDNCGKALAICQAIGDRDGEASTLYQIGFLAWKRNRREIGVRLAAICYHIRATLGDGKLEQSKKNLADTAAALGLDQAAVNAIVQEAVEAYQKDRGAALVEQAFEGL